MFDEEETNEEDGFLEDGILGDDLGLPLDDELDLGKLPEEDGDPAEDRFV